MVPSASRLSNPLIRLGIRNTRSGIWRLSAISTYDLPYCGCGCVGGGYNGGDDQRQRYGQRNGAPGVRGQRVDAYRGILGDAVIKLGGGRGTMGG